MKLRKLILTNNNCYKAGDKITPKGIMIHSTGANNPYLKRYVQPDDGLLGKTPYNNHFNTAKPGGLNKCPHAFIGRLADGNIATYQTLPWDYEGWHCGSGPKGSGNKTYISVEICEDDLKDPTYFKQVYQEAVEFAAYHCKLHGIKPEYPHLIDHHEGHDLGIASNHADVSHWFPKHGKSMAAFRADVKALLDRDNVQQKPPISTKPSPASAYYRVRKSANDIASQKGSFEDLDNAIALAKQLPGYAVFDNTGKQVYPIAQTAPTAAGAPYKVRKSWSDRASQKGAFKLLDNAVTECKKHPGYSVFDSAGKKLYTSPPAPAPVAKATGPVWVYAEADKESKVVVKLKAGTVMDVLGTVGAFYKVKAAGKTGYVSGNRVKIVSGTAKVPAAVFKLTRDLRVKDPILKGEDVRKVQMELLELGYDLGQWGADGKYGDATEAGVKDFQRDNGLQVDGWVGEKTCKALGGVWAAK